MEWAAGHKTEAGRPDRRLQEWLRQEINVSLDNAVLSANSLKTKLVPNGTWREELRTVLHVPPESLREVL